MDEKLTVVVEIEKYDQKFQFHMPYQFQFGAAYEAACEVASFLAKKSQERADNAIKQAQAVKEEAEKAGKDK